MAYTDEQIKAVIECAEDFGALGMDRDGPGFHWHDFMDRVERVSGVDLGSDMDAPIIRKIKDTAKRAWREANS